MTDERLAEIEMLARKYGSANCWTGTSGGLASVIIELIKEIRRSKDAVSGVHPVEVPQDERDGI